MRRTTLTADLSKLGVSPLNITPSVNNAVPPAVSPISLMELSARSGSLTPSKTSTAPSTGAHTSGFVTVDLRLSRRLTCFVLPANAAPSKIMVSGTMMTTLMTMFPTMTGSNPCAPINALRTRNPPADFPEQDHVTFANLRSQHDQDEPKEIQLTRPEELTHTGFGAPAPQRPVRHKREKQR